LGQQQGGFNFLPNGCGYFTVAIQAIDQQLIGIVVALAAPAVAQG
jgi:hypothetical protein